MICNKNKIFTLAAAIVPSPSHLGIHKPFLQNSFGNNGKDTGGYWTSTRERPSKLARWTSLTRRSDRNRFNGFALYYSSSGTSVASVLQSESVLPDSASANLNEKTRADICLVNLWTCDATGISVCLLPRLPCERHCFFPQSPAIRQALSTPFVTAYRVIPTQTKSRISTLNRVFPILAAPTCRRTSLFSSSSSTIQLETWTRNPPGNASICFSILQEQTQEYRNINYSMLR